MPEQEKYPQKRINLLVALTRLYIDSGEPVSSAVLSKALERKGESIPPSTVRVELGQLERDGYLVKPHPSGGIIPTAKAYQAYVEKAWSRRRPIPRFTETSTMQSARYPASSDVFSITLARFSPLKPGMPRVCHKTEPCECAGRGLQTERAR